MNTQQQPRTFKANSLRSRFFALCGFAMLVACLAAWGSVSGQQAYATEDTQAEAVSVGADEGTQTDTGMTYKVQAKSEAKAAKSADADASAKLPVVTVDAPEGALPEGAELHAELVESEKDTQAVADELEKADVAYDGFLALDVYFADADGNEVEPSEPVDVRFELPEGAVPEGAEGLAVHHLAEAEDGTVDDVKAVADDADATEGTVAVQDDATVDAEFTVESFSTFTIVWDSSPNRALNVHYGELVNGSVEELAVSASARPTFSSNDTVETFDAPEVNGYTYTGDAYAVTTDRLGDKTTTRIYDLRYQTGFLGNGRWQYNTSSSGSNRSWEDVDNADIYFIYEANQQQGDIYIEDDIFGSGSLVAKLADSEAEVSSYTWYRSANADVDGNYKQVDGEAESTLFVARDGARHYYYVEATLSDGSTLKSAPFQVEYYSALQNGSFENPDRSEVDGDYQLKYKGSNFMQIPNGTEGLIWQTTAEGKNFNTDLDNDYYTEIVKTTNGNSYSAYGIRNAADGDQFAELNCETAGALYQDVLTVPGSTLYWGLEHSDRSGGQSSRLLVLISDTSGLPDGFDPTNYSEIEDMGLEDNIVLDTTTSEVRWQYHSGSYVVPEGQYVTRFYFVAGNGSTEGNLLDNITFSAELPKPPAEKGMLGITKAFDGIDASDIPSDVSFTFTLEDKDGGTQEVELSAANNWTTPIALDPGEYTVTESAPAGIGSYSYSGTSTTVNGEDSQTGLERTVTIEEKGQTSITFTNSYTAPEPPKPVKPDFHKYVAKNDDGSYDLSLDVHGTVRSDQADPTKVDIVYVLDLSYSMMWDMDGSYPGDSRNPSGDDDGWDYSFERYKAATDAISALNDKLGQTGIDARAALVTFAHDTKGEKNFSSLNDFTLPDAAWSSFETGTNYEAGLTDALPIFNNARDDAQKVVVFISDGEPNRCLDNDGNEQDQNADEATHEAAEVAGQFNADKFYVVGVGDDQFENRLQEIVNGATSSTEKEMFKSSNREELISRFEGIAAEITSVNCTGVTITDTLSEYADLTDDAEFTVSITRGNHSGDPVAVAATNGPVRVDDNGNVENARFTFTDGSGAERVLTLDYNGTTKTFTLTFPEDYALEDGWTYIVTTQIEPSETAVDYFNENGSYPDTGDKITDVPGTAEENYISTDKGGFHTNTKATLTYESAGAQQTDEYPNPVITFDSMEIGYAVGVEKVLEGADLEENMFKFSIEARQTGDEANGTFVSADEAAKMAGLSSNPYVFSNGTTTSGAIDGLRGMRFTSADARAGRVFEYLITEKTGMSEDYQGDYSADDFVFDETQYLLQFKPVIVNGLLEVHLYQATIEDGNVSSAEPVLIGIYPHNGQFRPVDASLTQAEGGLHSRAIAPEYTLTFTNELRPLGLQIVKIEKDTTTRLPYAYFSLEDESGNVVPAYKEPEATEDNKLDADGQATNADGILYFYGLEDGEYTLTETRFPSGYQGDEAVAPVKFTIVVKDGAMWIDGMEDKPFKQARPNGNPDDGSEGNDIIDHCLYMQVSNTKIPDLPQSGSSGTLIMSSVGVATIILAGVYLLNRRFPLSK